VITVEIVHDEDAENPRTWDNVGVMVCKHRRYDLGDRHDLDLSGCAAWADVRDLIEARYPDMPVLPLYLYDHSGLALSTTPFACPWDSGQVGWIVATSCDEYGGDVEATRKRLLAEVEEYHQYLSGDVWGYVVRNGDEVVDSCFGYYGRDDVEAAAEEARLVAEQQAIERQQAAAGKEVLA
jgi:hypothetical protein